MAKILLNIPDNSEEPSKKDSFQEKKTESTDKVQEEEKGQVTKPIEKKPAQETFVQKPGSVIEPVKEPEDDFAIFPSWDVVPPNAIINPRIKKKI